MVENLTRKVALWATEVGTAAAQLPSSDARLAFLAEQRRQLVAGARREGMSEGDAAILAESCIVGAKRIMEELLRRGVTGQGGRA